MSVLTQWQRYRYVLNKVDTTTVPDINWPVLPVFWTI
ncbi:MAG TPA: hypothetical protein DDY57_07375 [Franconibacter pulveris]|nr:hypothetical protein [Franconibacter pulveris]